jgi:hypothetical protein
MVWRSVKPDNQSLSFKNTFQARINYILDKKKVSSRQYDTTLHIQYTSVEDIINEIRYLESNPDKPYDSKWLDIKKYNTVLEPPRGIPTHEETITRLLQLYGGIYNLPDYYYYMNPAPTESNAIVYPSYMDRNRSIVSYSLYSIIIICLLSISLHTYYRPSLKLKFLNGVCIILFLFVFFF